MNWKTTIPLVLILSCVFLVNLSQHIASGLPIHVDAWIEVSLADAITKQRSIPSTEPFSHTKLNDPIGNPVFQAAFSELTGLNLLHGATLLPALLNTILALLLYAVSMQLFNNKHTALAVAGFTPLILSQITSLVLSIWSTCALEWSWCCCISGLF
ncbi:hypothetical protein KY318_03120 [Candidatus Woesearchaeota archaeon]|nr:hypothetical protein [Candidatus Woesearchaeota archaeon]